MAASIELTAEQAAAVARLAGEAGAVALRQLGDDGAQEVYVTPRGAAGGYRITVAGEAHAIGDTTPEP